MNTQKYIIKNGKSSFVWDFYQNIQAFNKYKHK